jgi:leucyl-tRNA synthetase
MELVRDYEPDKISNDELNDCIILKTIQLVAPMAPHIAEEMWEMAGQTESVFKSAWPEYDATEIVIRPERVTITADAVIGRVIIEIEIPVQVNGKLRDSIRVPVDAPQETVEEIAFKSSRIKAHTEGKQVVKTIYVKGRILNIVVR